MPSVSTWAGFGSVLRQWLSEPARPKWFNITMAVLLIVSLWRCYNKRMSGFVSISQKIAMTAKKAGKPKANQMR
ncbi:hypothetical protein ABIA24_001511 [Sinorhizobium fredii]|nr:hypothetical protein EFR01_41190 [Sinorhizobium fredii]